MRIYLILVTILAVGIAASGHCQSKNINECFIDFDNGINLRANSPDKLPAKAAGPREVNTANGTKSISVVAGYRVLYLNEKDAPFVNLKVEKSSKKRYEKDQETLTEYLDFLNKGSSEMESKELIELEFNGYKLIGFSRASIEKGSTLGTFVLFPGDNTIVYFYFNNLKPEFSNFDSVESYRLQRDSFIELYIEHINTCN